MTLRSPEDRAVLRRAAEIRKADRKARPVKVQPIAAGQREPRKHDKPYLAWIRRLPCACIGRGICHGPVQAAHLRFSDAAAGRRNPGLQRKPDDRLTTPLCAFHHALQHGGAERGFWRIVGIDPAALCADLGAAYDAGRDGADVIRKLQSRSSWK